jgi:hypothetical protein
MSSQDRPTPRFGGETPDVRDWSAMPDELQLALAREALRRAADTLAEHAELLALEMETGALRDQGGPDALRLFAAVVRATSLDSMGPVGHA